MVRMLHLVDGYNVTMQDPATVSLSKEQQRDALVHRLIVRGRDLLGAGVIVVVFDARAQMGAASESVGSIKVVYAPDADSEIVRRCGHALGEVTVVTSDLRLRSRISQDVGRHVTYREREVVFDAARSSRESASANGRVVRDGGLPSGAKDITKELEDLWLVDDD